MYENTKILNSFVKLKPDILKSEKMLINSSLLKKINK